MPMLWAVTMPMSIGGEVPAAGAADVTAAGAADVTAAGAADVTAAGAADVTAAGAADVTAGTAADVTAAAAAVERALRDHLRAVQASTGEADPGVRDAFHVLREAFEAYDAVLYDVYDEVLPVEVVAYVEDEVDDGLEL